MKRLLLLQLAEVMAQVDLAQFCTEDDVSSESYGHSIADAEAEMAARCRHGARRFLLYVVEYGTLPPGVEFPDARETIESILLQGGE